MKKLLLLFVSALIVCAASSCRTHERCAAYGKINKIESEKPFSDKTEKEI